MTEQQLRAIHPSKPRESRARLLCHATRHMAPEEACELLCAALEAAERHGHRNPALDGYAVLRQAVVDACWVLEVSTDDTLWRVQGAVAILRRAVCAVDDEEEVAA